MSPEIPHEEPLLDPETRARLPELYGAEEQGLDALAQVKFFTPDSNSTWYASEGCVLLKDDRYVPVQDRTLDDPDVVDIIFFGLASGHDIELGYFALSDLQEIRGPLGLPIERDLYFQPKTLKELKALHERGLTG